MLIGLVIRDVVVIESLDLSFGPGLTALTGETGAGKSIILDALGLAAGARGEAALVRRGASQASATAIFALGPDHPAWGRLDEKGLSWRPDEDLVLRRSLAADGRSRAFVNDQPTGVGVLRELGDLLIEVHGQHETVGLLDPRTHRPLLDSWGGYESELGAVRATWSAWRSARESEECLAAEAARSEEEVAELGVRLSELDRLAPLPDEEAALAEERAVLGAAEKTLADIDAARRGVGGETAGAGLASAFNALNRARERTLKAGASAQGPAVRALALAAEAVDRALIEVAESAASIDAAAAAFDFEPDRLEKAEERLFALRGLARKLGVEADALPQARAHLARRLAEIEDLAAALEAARTGARQAKAAYDAGAQALSAARRAAGDALARAVRSELSPLKLDKARFAVGVEPAAADRAGPSGADRVEFQVATLPGAPFGPLGAIASGGELARFALALKASLAGRGEGAQPVMIFDEVDQGVGGAVADAVGQRLARLAAGAQVLVVTHSPQVAARADAHWMVSKRGQGEGVIAAVEPLKGAAREEEIARMLSGATITDAARAAARALMDA
ncbi:MAG: DNA repair protein RecN [Caulobacteraceae bacterium]